MSRKFYVALQDKNPYIFASWEECKKMQMRADGVQIKGFDDPCAAIAWVGSKGGVLSKEDFPGYLLHCEPVLSKPVTVFHPRSIAPEGYIRIYTDGSCLSNPGGPGGFGAVVLLPDGREIRLSGREDSTTNNRMELMAALSALDYLGKEKLAEGILEITVFTDSRYLRDIFEKGWIYRWTKNGWKTAEDKDVQNKDLLEILDWLVSSMPVRFTWIRGHNGNRFNEAANDLAFNEAKKAADKCGFFSEPYRRKPILKPKAKKAPGTVVKKEKTSVTIYPGKSIPTKNEADKDKNAVQKPVLKDGKEKAFTSAKKAAPAKKETKEIFSGTALIPKKKEENLSLGYTTVTVGRQRLKKNPTKAMPGNVVRSMVMHMNLLNGDKVIFPVSEKQVKMISLVLGISGGEGSAIRLFDEETLEKLLSCEGNPLALLWKNYKDPSFKN